MRSNDLRKTLKGIIENSLADYNVKEIYYKVANEQAMFPHIVFNLSSCFQSNDDLHRFMYYVQIDVYNKVPSLIQIEDLVDNIVNEFNAINDPQKDILPAFYFSSVNEVLDEDKKINHFRIMLEVHLYERN